jgi:hypothetical protein
MPVMDSSRYPKLAGRDAMNPPAPLQQTEATVGSALTRRQWCLGAAGVLGLAGCGTPPAATVRPWQPGAAGVVPFSASSRVGGLPEGWQEHVMRRDLPPTRYRAAQRDGRIVVHSLAERSTSGLRCDINIDPAVQPWLDWQWRVDSFPADISVARAERDDSPARVVLAFDGDVSRQPLRDLLFREQVEFFTGHTLPFATLMYVWDGHAAPESVHHYHRSALIRYMVVESGAGNTGQWMRYRRNVREDYQRVFGGEPGRIRSVGVLTDSDALKTRIEAWFGDLAFS